MNISDPDLVIFKHKTQQVLVTHCNVNIGEGELWKKWRGIHPYLGACELKPKEQLDIGVLKVVAVGVGVGEEVGKRVLALWDRLVKAWK